MDKKRAIKFLKKTFSHLTLFDWISILLVMAVIVVLGVYFTRRWEWVEAEIKVSPPDFFWTEKNPPFWLADSLRVGDGEVDFLGRKAAEIAEIKVFEAPGNKKSVYLKMKLRVVRDRKNQTYQFKSKQLAVGSPIELRFPRVFLTGVVTFVSGIPDTRVWEEKIVEVRITQWSDIFPETLGVPPWRVEAIKIGDQMKDTQGRIVAEVLDKKVRPAEKIVVTADGRVLVQQDPIKKDVILIVKLKTFKQEGINYFLDDVKIKVGWEIPLFLPQIDIHPEITKIIQ